MSASTNKEPAAIGSYSGFRHSGRLLITSGQLSLNPKTNRIEATGLHDQALQCLENIHCILQSEQMNFFGCAQADCLHARSGCFFAG